MKDYLTELRDFCYKELHLAIRWHTEKAFDRAYGAVIFVLNHLVEYDSPEGKEIEAWWADEMRPKFMEVC